MLQLHTFFSEVLKLATVTYIFFRSSQKFTVENTFLSPFFSSPLFLHLKRFMILSLSYESMDRFRRHPLCADRSCYRGQFGLSAAWRQCSMRSLVIPRDLLTNFEQTWLSNKTPLSLTETLTE